MKEFKPLWVESGESCPMCGSRMIINDYGKRHECSAMNCPYIDSLDPEVDR